MSWGKIKLRPSDILFSQYVRLTDGECLRCHKKVIVNHKGLPINLQASHYQGRRKEATRFDTENVCALCPGCHRYFTENPAEHASWQLNRLGKRRYEALILRSNTYKKRDDVMDKLVWAQALKDIMQ